MAKEPSQDRIWERFRGRLAPVKRTKVQNMASILTHVLERYFISILVFGLENSQVKTWYR